MCCPTACCRGVFILALTRAWAERWQVEAERAVRCLEKDFYHLLHYHAFPRELWKKIRATNALERTFREYPRRTRPMQVFPNAESAERIYYGVTDYLNRNSEERPQWPNSTKFLASPRLEKSHQRSSQECLGIGSHLEIIPNSWLMVLVRESNPAEMILSLSCFPSSHSFRSTKVGTRGKPQ